jgi:hypothetical protein
VGQRPFHPGVTLPPSGIFSRAFSFIFDRYVHEISESMVLELLDSFLVLERAI